MIVTCYVPTPDLTVEDVRNLLKRVSNLQVEWLGLTNDEAEEDDDSYYLHDFEIFVTAEEDVNVIYNKVSAINQTLIFLFNEAERFLDKLKASQTIYLKKIKPIKR